MKQADASEQGEIIIEDLSQEFKVFRDPTYQEFIEIVGNKYNPNLPLFAQLYILKEMLQFY